MKLLVVDQDSCHFGFAWRCALAGHEVKWCPKEEKWPVMAGRGFKNVQRVENWVSHVKWADLIVPTGNHIYLEKLDFFRKRGVRVFGPTAESASLEIERGKGMKFLEDFGIDTPKFKTFKTLADAEKHVWKTEERYVFKTMGDHEDKSLSYCSKSPADMIEAIRGWMKKGLNPKGEVMLQEFIKGKEFAVSRWLGPMGWISPSNENFEHKKFMSGNYGPNTGEMGTVVKYVKESKLFDDTLSKLEHPLIEMGHTGDVDLNFIIDEKGKAWALEFTCRFGYPANHIMMSLHSDPCQWMLDAFEGSKTLEVSYDACVGVVLALPPFPDEAKTLGDVAGKPIYGVTSKIKKYFQPSEVMIETHADMQGGTIIERPIWTSSNVLLGVITGTGKTIRQARERAYGTVKEISVANLEVRDDIGKETINMVPELQKLGYATDWRV